MPELLALACSFVRQLRCGFRCIAMAMQRKPCLADTQNPSAIFQHSTHDKTLETAVESRKSRQAHDAPRKTEKLLITNMVTANFSVSLCTPVSHLSFSHLTAVPRLVRPK